MRRRHGSIPRVPARPDLEAHECARILEPRRVHVLHARPSRPLVEVRQERAEGLCRALGNATYLTGRLVRHPAREPATARCVDDEGAKTHALDAA